MNRRDFVALLAGAGFALCAGCTSPGGGSVASASRESKLIDAGPKGNYAADGVYGTFREEGFFIITKNGKTEALSSICTHRSCLLDAEADRSFFCPCHGSTFSSEGKVTEGPATRNLPVLETSTGANGHLLVKVSAFTA
jgi:cytochrome b6-f complex iron-sulfur subunit